MTTLTRATAIALFGAALACGGSGTAQTPRDTASGTAAVDTASDTTDPAANRSKGSRSAPVTVFEMSDFQCPYCRQFAQETFPTIERDYIATGKVRWVFVNYPLTTLHPNAVPAAEFALCAGESGRFWPAHDLLFETQAAWARLDPVAPFLLGLSDSIGVPRDTMLACLQNPETRRTVQQEATSSSRAGATSTPSFYIEGGLLAGAHPISVFRQILDSVHATKAGGR